MTKERGEALLVFPGQPTLFANRKQVVDLAAKNRLPAMYPLADYVKRRRPDLLWGEQSLIFPSRRDLRG